MKSTIKIEMDYESMKPCIEVKRISSDDTRDGLLHYFTQSFSGSSLARIRFHYFNDNDPATRIQCMRIWALNEEQAKIEAVKLVYPTIDDWIEDYKAVIEQMDGKWKDNFKSIHGNDYLDYYNEGCMPRQAYELNKRNG